MKKIWAIVCVVGFTAFWVFGFIGLSGVMGDRPTHVMTFVLCLLGLGAGVAGWRQVMHFAPRMHGQRAAARVRLEKEVSDSMG